MHGQVQGQVFKVGRLDLELCKLQLLGRKPRGNPRTSAFSKIGLVLLDLLDQTEVFRAGGRGAKLVGPGYKEIAVKYKGRGDAIPYLSKRVRQGGPGNWGQVPMMANDVSKISDADLTTLLAWILKTS